jgi:hypothetical protein
MNAIPKKDKKQVDVSSVYFFNMAELVLVIIYIYIYVFLTHFFFFFVFFCLDRLLSV